MVSVENGSNKLQITKTTASCQKGCFNIKHCQLSNPKTMTQPWLTHLWDNPQESLNQQQHKRSKHKRQEGCSEKTSVPDLNGTCLAESKENSSHSTVTSK